MKRRRLITITLIIVFFLGLGILLYPTVSNWWNSRVMSSAISDYSEAVEEMTAAEYNAWFEAAEEYNQRLYEVGSAVGLTDPDILEGYYDILDLTGTGIMGYVTIPKIDVELPIYHGTSTEVLSAGAGHYEGTSFPVGGENVHAVISAHRGLPSALLFTHLDQMEVGDTFTVTVLNEVFTYEVEDIFIVEPEDIEYLYIIPGGDYCTLLTCTPYAVNSERLLVRGVRMEGDSVRVEVQSDAFQINSLLVALAIAVPLMIASIVVLLVVSARRKRRS